MLDSSGTAWQRFVWLAHWGIRPASGSVTRASRAGQGARPISVNLRTFSIENVPVLLGLGEVETLIWGLKLTLIGARPTVLLL